MRVTVTTTVRKCTDCPHFFKSMDGAECKEMIKRNGEYNGFVFPEGRYDIHPKCPLIRWRYK